MYLAIMLLLASIPVVYALFVVLAHIRDGLGEAGKPLILGGIAFVLLCPLPFFAMGFLLGAAAAGQIGILVGFWWFLSGCGQAAIGVLLKIAYLGDRTNR
ncbi:MAG: hypothetical protein OXE87_00630 [Chloroflexi bacterium]|nr:hypothetical protein [Chloroflexota bacterium]